LGLKSMFSIAAPLAKSIRHLPALLKLDDSMIALRSRPRDHRPRQKIT